MKTIALILLMSSVCFAAGPRPATEGDVVKCVGDGKYEHNVYNEPVGEIEGWLIPLYDPDGNMITCIHTGKECDAVTTEGMLCLVLDKPHGKTVLPDAVLDVPEATDVNESTITDGTWISRTDKPFTARPYTDNSVVIGEHTVTVGGGGVLTYNSGDIVALESMVHGLKENIGHTARSSMHWKIGVDDIYVPQDAKATTELSIGDQEPWHPSGTTDGDVLVHNGVGVLEWVTDPAEYINRKPTTENKKERGMFKIIVDFMALVGVTAAIAAFLVMGTPAVFRLMVSYVKEDDRGSYWEEKSWPGDDYIGNVALYHIIAPIFAGVVCFCFPATVPLGLIWLGLFSMRGFFRFRKKVSDALSLKSDKGHIHPEEVPE